jgi:hypothetical protein
MNEWHIQSRAHACQSCGQGFRDGAAFHTLLFDEKKEFLRMDICSDCWAGQYSEARDRRGFVSHWMGQYEPPPAAAPEAIRKDTAESLLRKLVELNDPAYLAASYILAVMLERKRLLRVKEQVRSEGHRTFIYEHPKSGDVFTIPDPDLQLNQLEEVQRQVAGLLEHGLSGSSATETPASGVSVTESVPAPGADPVAEGPVEPAPATPDAALPLAEGR